MSLILYLLRHGQTALIREDVFCGSGLDPELTPEGMEMARVFARTYREVEWRAVYSSSLRRSITTAQPLCDAVRINVQVRAELNEIAYGKWEGLTKEMVRVLGPHNCIQRIFVAAYSEAGHRLRFRLIR